MKTSNSDHSLLTPSECAHQIRVEESTLSFWRSKKSVHLPYVRIGGRIRYRQRDVEQFIERNLMDA
ncbi:helix-turn-helix domain-containing protein [Rhodoferax sp. GW822-FHT02A01]|uniref:helix-turn-helix domain-containing protein n=1 Tax=Rhodoferax sp. GW822-FHT02A01 TaxID=3141537 RepID=UPI00315CFE54